MTTPAPPPTTSWSRWRGTSWASSGCPNSCARPTRAESSAFSSRIVPSRSGGSTVVRTARRLAATLVAVLVAGCSQLPVSHAPAPPAGASAAAIDLGAKFRIPDRERGKRDKAMMNARYQLETEADENGPPSAARIFRAHEQREALA